MVNLKIETEQLAKKLAFSKMQTQKLLAVTLTQAAYNVQAGVQAEIRSVFRDPSDFVVKKSVVVKQAKINGETITPAEIGIWGGKAVKVDGSKPTSSSKVTPVHILYAQITGGTRQKKGSESRLSKVAPAGYPFWIPGQAAPLNASHDIPGAFIQKILSAMQSQSDPIANSKIKGSTGILHRDIFRGNKMGVTMKNGRILQGLRGYDEKFQAQMISKQNRVTKSGQRAGTNFFFGSPKGEALGPQLPGARKATTAARILYQFEWKQWPGKRKRPHPERTRNVNRPQLEQLIRDSLTQSPETHVHMLAACWGREKSRWRSASAV